MYTLWPAPVFLHSENNIRLTPNWWLWWLDFWFAQMNIAIERSDPRPFWPIWFITWKVWCLLFFHCVHFVHLSWQVLSERFRDSVLSSSILRHLLIYSFNNSLLSIFPCKLSLELIYVVFLTSRIESSIFLSLLYPSLPSLFFVL